MSRRKKKDEVEVIPLGKQPSLEKVHGAVDKHGNPMHLFKAKMEEQYEYRAKGRAVMELRGMAAKTVEKQNEREAQLEKRFGTDRIADRHGVVHRRRLDEIAELKEYNNGWGSKPVSPTFIVPDMPWKAKKAARPGRTRIRYVNGERVEEYRPA